MRYLGYRDHARILQRALKFRVISGARQTLYLKS